MSIIIILFVIFVCVVVGSMIQRIGMADDQIKKENTVYIFSQELLDMDLDTLRIERVSDGVMPLSNMRDRGSIRMAQGLVFDDINFEKRRVEEYLLELP